jgi:uncharacterized Ntn-hydrolase superfamily protein
MSMRIAVWLSALLLVATPAHATFAIAAIDPATGDLGVAVASAAVAIGARVPDGEAGVGVVATIGNPTYKRRGLELLRSGLPAQQVLDRLLAEDTFANGDNRQVVIIDMKGNVAARVGPAAQAASGVQRGRTYAVVGNGVIGTHVLQAIATAFEGSSGELAERLYTALRAGALAGGDRQPDTATGILVIRKQYNDDDGYVSVRVDSSADPFHELRRVLDLQLARNYAGLRNYLVENGKLAEALPAAEKAVHYEPAVGANHLHLGFLAYLAGQHDRALQAFTAARQLGLTFKQTWDAALRNPDFAAYGKVRDDTAFVDRVMK